MGAETLWKILKWIHQEVVTGVCCCRVHEQLWPIDRGSCVACISRCCRISIQFISELEKSASSGNKNTSTPIHVKNWSFRLYLMTVCLCETTSVCFCLCVCYLFLKLPLLPFKHSFILQRLSCIALTKPHFICPIREAMIMPNCMLFPK